MPNFAIYKDNVVINVIFAENKEIAEQVTGMSSVETEGVPWINWTLIDGEWVSPEQNTLETFE